jgi:hypothetical protein
MLAKRRAGRWFALAGIVGGIGMWISVSTQVPILGGIVLGGLLVAWTARRIGKGTPGGLGIVLSWRAWGLGGAATILAAYLIEYYPAHLGAWRLEAVHPVYGLAWLGAGELLARAAVWIDRGKLSWRLRDIGVVVLAAAAVATVPVVMRLAGTGGFLATDLLSLRLTNLSAGMAATSFWAWLRDEGFTLTTWATLLPLLLVLPGVWLLTRGKTEVICRLSLGLVLGPVLIALGLAFQQLSWWSMLDGALLVLMVAATAGRQALDRRLNLWLWSITAALFIIPGVICLLPQRDAGAEKLLTSTEAEELIERDLAHWLAKHEGGEGVVVYAPPNETITLCFFGGLRGVGTFSTDNKSGLRATVTIASVTTLQEAQVLLQERGIRYIVIPSWDPFFEEYARLYLAKNLANWQAFFIPDLRRWNLPLWLRPVSYQMPKIGGFEGQSVQIFEVVDEQSPAVAASRLAEYLIEIGELDRAASAEQTLRRFPGDIGALAARAQVESARGDTAGFEQTLSLLTARLSNGADRYLPWDRRVSLAIVMARGKRIEQARDQTRRCLKEINEDKVRSLPTGSLCNLLVLGRAFDLAIADPKLRELSLDLLPGELRARLKQ